MRVGSRSSSPSVRPSSSTCAVEPPAAPGEQHVAGEGVAVGVQAARAHRDRDVADATRSGPEQLGRPRRRRCRHRRRRTRRGPAARGARRSPRRRGRSPPAGSPRRCPHDRGDPLGHDLAGGDVVGHEQRLGPADDEVVDDHRHEVDADRVVLVQCLRDDDLGADAVGRGREQRAPIALERRASNSPAKPPRPPSDLGPLRPRHRRLHQLDGALTRLDVDPGSGVRRAGGGRPDAPATPVTGGSGPSVAAAAADERRVASAGPLDGGPCGSGPRAGACRAARARAARSGRRRRSRPGTAAPSRRRRLD